MSPIKDFGLTYEALNEEGTFSEGDTLTGTISFALTKEIKVKSLFVKVKGDANVHWTEGSGDDERSYSAHRRYFKVKEYLIAENAKGAVLPQGLHHFKFRLKIPEGDMPSSFTGLHGKIVYMLEAKMSRSWRWPSKVQKHINFVSKFHQQLHQVNCPQSGSVSKEMGVFSKGQVQMSAVVNTKICSPGDTLSVVAKICNSSSKKVRPKFSLQQKTVYRAEGSTNTSEKNLCKIVGDTIPSNSEETVSCQVKIPADSIYSLSNCEIISIEYYLKVYLDISFAIDPKVVFLLVIVPPSLATSQPLGPYPAGAVGGPSYSDFPPPFFPFEPPVPAGPGAYGYPAPDPTQYATSGYNNQWTQQGFSTADFLSSAQPQVGTAPPQFEQGEEPPSYMSLFPPAPDTLSGSGSSHKS
ncbi:arrestin domain-containing protein 3-like isoform X2 [Mastacembelus armatus]|uniref:arrestin domain-containing protein 3-like isoform X2 n=1 Tax=Mastacembelus armatus TaxID=205130 RepID=UPI000E45C45E|nr:arrestin domain-containing protein 3-like isoform X2 [Mastacembelus armatus]